MSLLDRLRSALGNGSSGQGGRPGEFYVVKVRCRRCGEVLSATVNLQSDLSIDYERDSYYVRKLISGSGANRCFQQIELQLTFDTNMQLVDRQIAGGSFVDEPTDEPG